MRRSRSSLAPCTSHLEPRHGFSLIELLLTLGIVAVLAVVVVLVLNPAQQLKKSRDAARLDDLATLTKAVSEFQGDQAETSLGTSTIIYISIPDSTTTCANLGLPLPPTNWSYHCAPSTAYRKIDGTGWVPIDFRQITYKHPIGQLPVDPLNSTSTRSYYTYVTSGGRYNIAGVLESSKYVDTAAGDGGYDPVAFELGSDLSLAPFAHGLLGWWKFDEGSGSSAADASGFGTTLTVGSLMNWTAAGKIGGAIQVDPTVSTGCVNQGSGAYKLNPLPPAMQPLPGGEFTISWWNNAPGGGASRVHLATTITVTSCGNCSIWTTVNIIRIVDSNQNSYNVSFTAPSTGVWHHMATVFSRNGGYAIEYVDGKQVGRSNVSTSANFGTGNWFAVGVYSPSCSDAIPGTYYDDVRLYSRALSASEVQSIYNAGR